MTQNLSRLQDRLAQGAPVRWVFAGDSITQGALHTMGWRDYTELFSERVRWELQRLRDCVINTAVSGWKISTILDDLEWSILQQRPDVLLINFGMNDAAGGGNGLAEFRAKYLEVVTTVRQRLDPIIVMQTPNLSLPADTVRAPHLASYADTVRKVAEETGCTLVDHAAAWEPWNKDGSIAYLLSDALHPNECGHRLMARTLLSSLGLWDGASRVGRLFVP